MGNRLGQSPLDPRHDTHGTPSVAVDVSFSCQLEMRSTLGSAVNIKMPPQHNGRTNQARPSNGSCTQKQRRDGFTSPER
jgi:hypothetical protein